MSTPGDLTGAISQAVAVIRSVQVDTLNTLAQALGDAGKRSAEGGRTLTSSAEEVGAQQGDPYVAYRERLTPVATWMSRFEQPATQAGTNVTNAATIAQQAQDQAKIIVASISGTPTLTIDKQQQDALNALNGLIDQISVAFGNIQPVDPGTAPVKDSAGGAGGAGAGAGSTAQPASATSGAPGAAAGSDAGGGAAGGAAGGADAGAAAAAGGAQAGLDPTAAGAVGPTSGPFNGWVQDPNSGNLVDPATGREVNAGGQFLDPVTGQPFGDAAQSMSRLEGLQGGVDTTGGLFGGGGVGAFAATGGGGGGAGGGFAGLYGGMMPPSMMGSNPAMGQLQAKANQNLQAKAATAQRYSAIMTGQDQARPYMPPMGGAGGGMGGGGRAGRPSRRLVSEPSNVWGATGRGDRDGRKRSAGATTELAEDADVWTGGDQAGSGLLDR